ncbi:type III-B CRISPR module RAMP protein Cmr4 [Kosmotoga sp. DU53]|uniref:type III-B CRISPR module RAMP protein Cmr4 n=1 Tax=Kosmotoga sp. DU53 TaxID=1310160 RepID=UPI0007C4E26D|nr:type III-B CRISPR module RAMP protein Cmr4 [Kosmotoga sp. DU53]OAA23731.1 hypothetical protein DU53_02545 [Kosmotoga sp. DU53]
MSKMAFYLYAETQIHAGKGADVGIVDLPIQRERTTGFPVIQGIKGSLRNSGLIKNKNDEIEIFGSSPEEKGATKPGNVAFSEAKILLFPVRSPERVFVWVTCPMVLHKFKRMADMDLDTPEVQDCEIAYVCDSQNGENEIWIEEFKLSTKKDEKVSKIAEVLSECAPDDYIKNKIKRDLIIVSDKMFQRIVRSMTEIVPRIRIGENGVVQDRALWYEEYLPQDTVMYFVAREIMPGKESLKKLDTLNNKVISIGGKETVGKGIVMIKKVI